MSAFDTFSRCRKKFDYQEVRGWIPRSRSWAMTIGTGFHICLAAGYAAVRDFDAAYRVFAQCEDAWPEQDPNASAARALSFISAATEAAYNAKHDRDGMALGFAKEDHELLEDMVRYFWEHLGAEDLKTIWQILSVEEPAYIQIGDVLIRTTFDLVASVVTNISSEGVFTLETPVVFDHKTVGEDAVQQALSFLQRDFQTRAYYSSARGKYGKPTRFVHTFVARVVPPGFGHRSLLTPTGKTRSAATLVSMQDVNRYLRRESTPLSDAQIDAFEGQLVKQVADVERAKIENYFPPSPIKGHYPGCDGCPYEGPCAAEIDGRDVPLAAIDLSYILRGSDDHKALLAGRLELPNA
jgi:hypothetical protein